MTEIGRCHGEELGANPQGRPKLALGGVNTSIGIGAAGPDKKGEASDEDGWIGVEDGKANGNS